MIKSKKALTICYATIAIICLSAAIATIVIFFLYCPMDGRPISHWWELPLLIVGILSWIAISMAGIGICLATVGLHRGEPEDYFLAKIYPRGAIFVNESNSQVVKVLEQNEFFLNKDDPYTNLCQYNSVDRELYGNYAIKVNVPVPLIRYGHKGFRKICCSIKVQTPKDVVGLQKLLDELGGDFPNYRNRVRSLLYDFCHECADQLTEFNNPLRLDQQEKFRALISNWLAPALDALGLKLAETKFSFSD